MNQDFKNALWGTANALRGSVDPSDYKYPVLGLIFLKYASESFAARRKALEKAFSDPNDDLYLKDPDARVSFLEDRNYYVMENVLWVPERARWPFIQGNAKQFNIAVLLDEAMGLIEADNPKFVVSGLRHLQHAHVRRKIFELVAVQVASAQTKGAYVHSHGGPLSGHGSSSHV